MATASWLSIRRPVRDVAVAAVYGAALWLGLALAVGDQSVTLVAPASGIGVAALVLVGRRIWPAIALGALTAYLVYGLAPHVALGLAAAATLGPLAVHAALERTDFQPQLSRTRDLIALLVAAMLGMLAGATLVVLVLFAGGALGDAGLARTWLTAWFGGVAGVLLVTPLVLTLGAIPWHQSPLRRRPAESALFVVALVLGSAAAVWTHTEVAFIMLLVGLLAAVRLEQTGAAVAAVVFASFGVWGTVDPAVPGGRESLLLAQGLHVTLGLLLLSIGTVTSERRSSRESLERAATELERRVGLRTRDLASAQRLAHIGSFSWDAASDTNTWSEELFRIYGLDPAQGPPSFEEYLRFVRPDHLEQVRASVEEAIATGRTLSHTYPAVAADGRELWVHAHVEVDLDGNGTLRGLYGACQDVTDRQRAEERLRTSEARFRALLEAGPDAVVVVDERGDIVLTNDQTSHLLGYEPHELVGRSVDVLIPSGLRDAHASHRSAYVTDPHRRPMGAGIDLSAVHRDGRLVPVDVSLSPVTTDGTTYVVAAMRDATERRAMETALRSAYEREHEAAQHLRELDTAKNAFLTAVSHELRTPLTSIIGFAELLSLQGTDHSDAGEIVERIEVNARRLSGLLEDLLDLNRLQRGVFEPRRRRVSTSALVSSALEDMDLDSHRVEVEVEEQDAYVDVAQVERIIENLVHNAMKYGGDEPIELRLSALPAGGIEIHVSDRGSGVPDDMKDRVFEPFTRVNDGGYTQGTGIGLALVDQFARLHGGRAWVTDRPGGGSVFHVRLPDSHRGPHQSTAA